MNTFDTLFSRRSVRSYTGEPASESDLETILKAADASPIAMGKYEVMHLTVIQNRELLDKIDAAGAKFFQNPDMHPLYHAPALILVSTKKPEKNMENVAYSNAAIIVENMAIAATALNLGACHIWGAVAALSSDGELVSKLGLPEGYVPCCGLTVGKTDEAYSEREIPSDRISKNRI